MVITLLVLFCVVTAVFCQQNIDANRNGESKKEGQLWDRYPVAEMSNLVETMRRDYAASYEEVCKDVTDPQVSLTWNGFNGCHWDILRCGFWDQCLDILAPDNK